MNESALYMPIGHLSKSWAQQVVPVQPFKLGDVCILEGDLQGLGDTREEDLYSIRDLAKKWNSIRAAKPAVLVRVVLKSRMIHYAKPNKSDKWPFQVK